MAVPRWCASWDSWAVVAYGSNLLERLSDHACRPRTLAVLRVEMVRALMAPQAPHRHHVEQLEQLKPWLVFVVAVRHGEVLGAHGAALPITSVSSPPGV